MNSASIISHQRLQHYKKYYFKATITGLVGCRWQRYRQSEDETNKKDFAWFLLFVLVYLYLLFWFFFWLVAGNSYDEINWFMFDKSDSWFNWYHTVSIITTTAFCYFTFLMVLITIMLVYNQELYIHWIHRIVVVVSGLACIAATLFINIFFHEGFELVLMSLQIMGPYIHLASLCIVTFFSWFIMRWWMTQRSIAKKTISSVLMLVFLIAVLSVPLVFNFPCVCETQELYKSAQRPRLVAHRGASTLRPENTKLAFQYAAEQQHPGLFGFETDVTISWDGIPFLMHDENLRRTTNVMEHFPNRSHLCASRFTWQELQGLSAGSWFLDTDPHGTVSSLTEEEKLSISSTKILSFEEFLMDAKRSNVTVMFDLKYLDYIAADHPFYENATDVILAIIQSSSINSKMVYWLYRDVLNYTTNFSNVLQGIPDRKALNSSMKNLVNMKYSASLGGKIMEYKRFNVAWNIYVINHRWLFSLLWCEGVTSITTNVPHLFANMDQPSLLLSSKSYMIVWIVTEATCIIIMLLISVIQRLRHGNQQFHPENISLNTVTNKVLNLRQSRNMREKLLHTLDGYPEVKRNVMGTSINSLNSQNAEIAIGDKEANIV